MAKTNLKSLLEKGPPDPGRGGGTYTIVAVTQHASKREIARAVEEQFKVNVSDVRIIRFAGHGKRKGRFLLGRKSWRAVVTLAGGGSIAPGAEALAGRASSAPPHSPGQLAAIADYHRARQGFATDADLADVLGVHRTRLEAWKRGAVSPNADNARLLSHVAVTVGELAAFLDPDVIPDWFLTEQFSLDGRTPAEALREGQLADVLFAANATEHGAYV